MEQQVRRLLGLSPEEVDLLIGRAKARLGSGAYGVRIAAFVVATAPLARLFLPRRLRMRAISAFLFALLPGPSENLLYARGISALRESAADEPHR